ncbi:response regulator transcription factor [Gordonia rhizosphera]|uniref:HTH luxR-type domain-containing protein n=1 Tax=Gordonia rhizosphera NBRC 16068 TaxID=1108045 RepID=K6WWT0_9ACTN|nr:helix-turn-helix transcriptional regulator [Gordonia rhizosphera]GAB91024.1 hypothetical protein GORHZ_121_00170 [Gordonia rhizosphera NBRC 16068]
MNPLPSQHRTPSLLSDREIEVLTQWLVCDSKREVGQALFISAATVQTHLARIRGKYEDAGRPAGTKIALLIRAIEDGYITLNEVAQRVDGVMPAESEVPMAAGAEGDIAPRLCHSLDAARRDRGVRVIAHRAPAPTIPARTVPVSPSPLR